MTMSREQATELVARARRSHWPKQLLATGSSHQPWFGHLVTQLALLAGDEPVDYCDSRFETTDAVITGELALFTATRLVRATGGPDGTKAWAIGRTELLRVVTDESADFFGRQLEWPPPASVHAFYPEETLHLHTGGLNEIEVDRFHEFLPSLLADLGAGRVRRQRGGQGSHHRAGWAW